MEKESDFVTFSGEKKKNRIQFYLILGITFVFLLVIIILLVYYFQKPSVIKQEEIAAGKDFDLNKGKSIKFDLNDEEHLITADSIKNNSVTISVQSEKKIIVLIIGEEKTIDINGDGKEDILVKLKKIENEKAYFKIKKVNETENILAIINETSCSENWQCTNWSICNSNGNQTRNCTDTNNCGTFINKPEDIMECEIICNPIWNCTNWSICNSNGNQTRNCTDTNNCDDDSEKPTEKRNCSIACIERWVCTNWTSCLSNEQVRSCNDTNSCGTRTNRSVVFQNCGTIPDGTNIIINDKLLYKNTEIRNNTNCLAYNFAPGQCNLTIINYKGIYGNDSEKHYDATALYVFIISFENISRNDFFNNLSVLYKNTYIIGNYSNNKFYKYAEGTPEQRAANPGEADEGVSWVNGSYFILLHHNGINGEASDGQKSKMYFNALLEIYIPKYTSEIV